MGKMVSNKRNTHHNLILAHLSCFCDSSFSDQVINYNQSSSIISKTPFSPSMKRQNVCSIPHQLSSQNKHIHHPIKALHVNASAKIIF